MSAEVKMVGMLAVRDEKDEAPRKGGEAAVSASALFAVVERREDAKEGLEGAMEGRKEVARGREMSSTRRCLRENMMRRRGWLDGLAGW